MFLKYYYVLAFVFQCCNNLIQTKSSTGISNIESYLHSQPFNFANKKYLVTILIIAMILLNYQYTRLCLW